MKIAKINADQPFDFTYEGDMELSSELKGPSVYKQIAMTYADSIPIVKHVSKDEQSVPLNIRAPYRLSKMMELMAMHSGLFTTKSEIVRAALHVGMHVLYHLIDAEQNASAKKWYNLICLSEQDRLHNSMIDEAVDMAKIKTTQFKQGRITEEEFRKWLQEIVDTYPGKDKWFLKEMLQGVVRGDQVEEVFGIRKRGQRIDLFND